LERCLFRFGLDDASFCRFAKVVNTRVLMVESTVQDSPSNTSFREHTLYEGFEFHKSMVQFSRNWTLELELICLETKFVRP
jgi:hypothetical protein